jgi:hypothetical protein
MFLHHALFKGEPVYCIALRWHVLTLRRRVTPGLLHSTLQKMQSPSAYRYKTQHMLGIATVQHFNRQ